MHKKIAFVIILLATMYTLCMTAYATDIVAPTEVGQPADVTPPGAVTVPSLNISLTGATEENTVSGSNQTVSAIQMLLLLTLISLSPYILIMMTSFTRIIITLHFLRSALGTQQMPPNQLLMGLALFLTFFLMAPTFNTINETALTPLTKGELTQEEAITKGMEPLRDFMFTQVYTEDITLFSDFARISEYESMEGVPNRVLIPAFILGEIKRGFIIGFIIYIPFIAIDMVVASVLMAMGMMMLPPAMISLPFKVLLFVMVNGWELVIGALVKSFLAGGGI